MSVSFDTHRGKLSVDYAGYLSKHDIVYNTPMTSPDNGMAMGNGRVGAMIWHDDAGRLTMQIINVDASPQTQLSSGRLKLNIDPGTDGSGGLFEQRLHLHDGLVTIKQGSGIVLTIFGDPDSELLGINVKGGNSEMAETSLDLYIWDTVHLFDSETSYFHRDLGPDTNAWKNNDMLVLPDAVAISRGLADPDNFGYTLMASVQGTGFTTCRIDDRKLRINMTPAPEYTIWIANASRRNSQDLDLVSQASGLISGVKITGYPDVLCRSRNWWHEFWSKSFVSYSDTSPESDYIENNYYISMYLIAIGSRGIFPFHFINGVARCDDDVTRWSWGYWHLNTRAVYRSFYASNHIELLSPYFNYYSGILPRAKSDTKAWYGIDGAKISETIKWNGAGMNVEEYVCHIFSASLEIAANMHMKYKYTGDTSFLKDVAYPLMREVTEFYAGYLTWDGAFYRMKKSHSHENYWDVDDSAPDIAAVKSVFPMTIEASEILGIDAVLRSKWRDILSGISPLPEEECENGARYLPCASPVPESHNVENPECEMIWPFGLTGIGAPDYLTALNTWKSRKYDGYIYGWCPDAVLAARLGLGDDACEGMKTMVSKFQVKRSGINDDGNAKYESNGLLMTAMNESLMQSYNGIIRVFPAVPGSVPFKGAFTLLAVGGFLVSSEMESGEIKYVGIKSLLGNIAVVANPWPALQVCVRRVSDGTELLVTDDSIVSISTETDEIYVLERAGKPFCSYSLRTLTGSPNNGIKTLAVGEKTVHLGY